jgi:hypothetical protein
VTATTTKKLYVNKIMRQNDTTNLEKTNFLDRKILKIDLLGSPNIV